jgi:hypothetical protein
MIVTGAALSALLQTCAYFDNPPPIFDYPRQGGGFRHKCSHQPGEGKKPENGAMTGFSEIRWWIMAHSLSHRHRSLARSDRAGAAKPACPSPRITRKRPSTMIPPPD